MILYQALQIQFFVDSKFILKNKWRQFNDVF